MQVGKIFGAFLIAVGICLLTLQIAWTVSGRTAMPDRRMKTEREYKSGPYAGIFGVALIVGGIGFVFTAGRKDK